MKTTRTSYLIAFALVCTLAATARAADSNIEKKQQDVRTMAQSALQRLCKAEPKAKGAVERAAGYAVFSNME